MKIALIVFYLVIAIAMITFIMMQRGSGATAGSGFGAGASGTVFGARGSANFLSSSTKWLAILFFSLSMGMAVYENRTGTARAQQEDLGVMGQLPTTPETPAPSEIPAAPSSEQSPAGAEVPPAPGSEAASASDAPEAGAAAAATTSETSDTTGDKPAEKTP